MSAPKLHARLTEKQIIAQFRECVAFLNGLMEQLREKHPDAGYYLASDMLHLMKGPTHTESQNPRPLYDNSLACEALNDSGGGDW